MKPVGITLLLLVVFIITNGFTCKKKTECDGFVVQLDYDDVNNSIGTQTVHGQPPFTYEWSNGSKTSFLIPPGSGTYSVTVTDLNRCGASSFIKVP